MGEVHFVRALSGSRVDGRDKREEKKGFIWAICPKEGTEKTGLME